ncbi:MAG: hypothetical protein HC905_06585 [Bacteroidales bacterium]|nr:hypothetical protein [Bacteroidales bacterium]
MSDFNQHKGLPLLKEDLQKVRYHNIGRFPAITMLEPGSKGIIVIGYRPFSVLVEAFEQLAGDLLSTGSSSAIVNQS